MTKLRPIFIFLLVLTSLKLVAFEFEGVSPIFMYGEWDKVKYYTNLTASKDNFNLDLDQYENGFVINTKRRIGLATGFVGRLTGDLTTTNSSLDLGLAPVVKSYASFVNRVNSLDEAEKKIQFIPVNQAGLEKYKIGDSALFELVGGVVFHAGLTTGVAHVGGKFLIAGGWTCYVQKINQTQVYVELKKIKEINKSFYLNATIPYYENGNFKDDYHGFSYVLDFTDERGMEAYKHFLLGQLDEIEEVPEIVVKLKTLKSEKTAHLRGYGVGVPYVPFLNYAITKEDSINDESIIDLLDHETKNKYTLSLKRHDTSAFFYRKLIDTAFLISSEKNVNEMQLFFKHVTNFTKSEKISEVRDELIEITGLNDFLNFKVSENEKLGFAQIQFAINFGEKIKNAIYTQKEKFANLLLDEHFEKASDEKKKNEMVKLILKDKITLSDVASFGQNFWHSKALFKFQYNLVLKCGGEMSYEVSGKRISRLLRNKVFTETADCPL